MSKVNVVNVIVLDNPCSFNNQFQFEIVFESYEDLQEDLEWKIIYVGSAESEDYDQILDSVLVGPVPAGTHKFLFQAPPPDSSKIPVADSIGVTVLLLTCSYKDKEFVRIGYYVNIEYTDPELRENPPPIPDYSQLQRNILATNPRVTKFTIDWGDNSLIQHSSAALQQSPLLTQATNLSGNIVAPNLQTAPFEIPISHPRMGVEGYEENLLPKGATCFQSNFPQCSTAADEEMPLAVGHDPKIGDILPKTTDVSSASQSSSKSVGYEIKTC